MGIDVSRAQVGSTFGLGLASGQGKRDAKERDVSVDRALKQEGVQQRLDFDKTMRKRDLYEPTAKRKADLVDLQDREDEMQASTNKYTTEEMADLQTKFDDERKRLMAGRQQKKPTIRSQDGTRDMLENDTETIGNMVYEVRAGKGDKLERFPLKEDKTIKTVKDIADEKKSRNDIWKTVFAGLPDGTPEERRELFDAINSGDAPEDADTGNWWDTTKDFLSKFGNASDAAPEGDVKAEPDTKKAAPVSPAPIENEGVEGSRDQFASFEEGVKAEAKERGSSNLESTIKIAKGAGAGSRDIAQIKELFANASARGVTGQIFIVNEIKKLMSKLNKG